MSLASALTAQRAAAHAFTAASLAGSMSAGTDARAVSRRARSYTQLTGFVALTVVMVACAGGPSPVTDDPPASALSPSLGIDLAEYTRTPEGLFYKDVLIGTGALADDRSKVTVAYRGLLATGVQVDSSAGLSFKMGSGIVIKGWQIGLKGMRAGGARILVIPPHLGYGWKEVGAIPPNSILLFRVQLVAVQ